jgi:hypothetical protein
MDTPKSIQPVVLRTDNVAKEIIRIAQSNKVPVATLDFSLLSVQTFTRMSESEEWQELDADALSSFGDSNVLLNETFQMKQTYEIEVFTKVDICKLDGLDLSIGANSRKTKVYLTIKEGSHVDYFEEFGMQFTTLVNKKKLRANLLIEVFDEPMKEAIKTLRSRLEINDSLDFEKKEIFQIAQGFEPLDTVHDALILHYEAKRPEEDDAKRVDYSKRGYLLSTVVDELLIEYIKPKQGKPGRDCRGQYIKPEEPKIQHEPTFSVSEKIEVVDTDDAILYKAKSNGYVTFENATYDIRTEVDVPEISFKTTGSIETDLNADVSINVKENDVLKDAVGMGMEVEVNEIHVEGNVGPKAIIRAMKAYIEGQTHQSSHIEAETLNINIHKGVAKGGEIDITRLEHGRVEGDVVRIKQAIGGVIKAREIYIETLGSHVKAYAAERIEINKLQGGENTLMIDPLVIQEQLQNVEESEKMIVETERLYRALKEEVAKYELMVRKNEPAYLEIKKKLVHYKKSAIKMPEAFVKKFKEFQEQHEHLESLRSELYQKREKIELLRARHNASQNDIFEARIINNDHWRNHNELVFKLVEPPIQVSFVPEHGDEHKIYGLKEYDDEYFIVPKDEE